MKTPQARLIPPLLALLLAPLGHAQTIDQVLVQKTENFAKTTAGAPIPLTGDIADFGAQVTGTDLSGIPRPMVTPPAGSPILTSTAYHGGLLSYSADDEQWEYDVHSSSGAMINAGFLPGEYTVTADGDTFDLDLPTTAYPAAPNLTFSQGTWSGGVLDINPNEALTITSSIFSTYDSGTYGGHIGLDLNSNSPGDDFSVNANQLSTLSFDGLTPDPTTDFITVTIPADTLIAGNSYSGNLEFDQVEDYSDASDIFAASTMSAQTNFTIFAEHVRAPDEATTLGLLGLALVGLSVLPRQKEHRRP